MNNVNVHLPHSNDNLVENSMSKVILLYDFINVLLKPNNPIHGYAPKVEFGEKL